MASLSVDSSEAWAFGPQAGTRVSRRGGSHPWRPFGLAAGVVAGLGLALVLGFVAFVSIAGRDDPVPATVSAPPAAVPDAAVPDASVPDASVTDPVAAPLVITDVQLTAAVDAATGEPGSSTRTFGTGEPVNLWLSFEAGYQTGPLTAVWFRGHRTIATLTAPLPGTASQMVFPLPQVAVDRPGAYRVEVRSGSDVLAAESFEVT
jgi:hypothetical protein